MAPILPPTKARRGEVLEQLVQDILSDYKIPGQAFEDNLETCSATWNRQTWVEHYFEIAALLAQYKNMAKGVGGEV